MISGQQDPKIDYKEPSVEKGLLQIKCKMNHPSSIVCANSDCKLYPFMCSKDNCQCQVDHGSCPTLVTKNVVKAVKNKIITLGPLKARIDDLFQKMIDRISDYKQKLLDSFKGKFFDKYYGLQSFQADFLKAIEKSEVKNIINNDLWKVLINLKTLSQQGLNFDNKKKRIQKEFQKFDQQIDKLFYHLTQKVESFGQKQKIDSLITRNNDDSLDRLEGFFKNKRIKQFNLLYRATQNNFLVNLFHQNCDGIQNTLVICKTQYDKIVGGFTPLPWRNGEQFIKDRTKETFIFSLTNNHKFVCMKGIPQISSKNGPCFGFDLLVYGIKDSNQCTSNINYSYLNENYDAENIDSCRLFSGSSNKNFQLKQWQVFKVIFEE